MIGNLMQRLNQEIEDLVEEITVRIPAQLGEDQSVEAQRTAAELQRHIHARIGFLHNTRSALGTVSADMVPQHGAGFGSEVALRDLDSKTRLTYKLMAGDVIDLDAGEISLASPVGQSLVGRKAGEVVEVNTPHGLRRFKITSVRTLHEGLGEAVGLGAHRA